MLSRLASGLFILQLMLLSHQVSLPYIVEILGFIAHSFLFLHIQLAQLSLFILD
jgi:hypothetical protein